LKPKTGFESGSSPTATATVRVSENGAPIQTGHGLKETKRRIMDAFEKIRQYPAQHPVQHSEPTPQPQVELVYTEHHKTRFHERAKRLSLAALETSHISTSDKRANVVCWEISVPSETAEELIREALGE
jgi:hypothetical protein